MKLSLLQLEGYYIKDLSVSFKPELESECQLHIIPGRHMKDTGLNLNEQLRFKVNAEFRKDSNNPYRHRIDMLVESDDVKNSRFPYTFSIRIVGFFNINPSLKINRADDIVKVNGPSILFGVAREAIANVTSRGPVPAAVLPTVTFIDYAQKKPKKLVASKRKLLTTKKK